MKIGVIFTGGTIGSAVDESGYIATKKENAYLLLQLYREQMEHLGMKEEIIFVSKNPYTILSENLSGKELELLIRCISEFCKETDIDGIIVTHGTDTLQYTAAVLGYVFSHVKIPIILVSSNYVLGDARANGLKNFFYGVEFIKGNYGKGVFVSYCNEEETPIIHYGTRLNMPVFYSDYVSSIEKGEYGFFAPDEGSSTMIFYRNNRESVKMKNPAADGPVFLEGDIEKVRLMDCNRSVLQIHPFVGMKYPSLSSDVKVILHGSYHSGTIGMTDELKTFAKKAEEMEIPFYLIGLSFNTMHYETVKLYEAYHIIPLYDTAFIAQYCKAWLAVSNHLDIRTVMEQEIAYDTLTW